MKFRTAAVTAALALTSMVFAQPAQADGWRSLTVTTARADNPLKGFVPFSPAEDRSQAFPHTMEWVMLPLKAVVKGERTYDWSAFETELEAAKSRGHQVALRFYLDNPGKPTGVPDYLLGDGGIDQSRRYSFYNNNGISFSPDYNDPRVQSLITDFTAAFGAKYDGDPRIGYITTGLVGFWGEQHTYPMSGDVNGDNPDGTNWMPSREVELGFYQAWDQAFSTTKLLNRNPQEGLENTAVGFHDDSFAYSTLQTADWHFLSRMHASQLTDRWQTEAVGGELYPSLQSCLFEDPLACQDSAENFNEAVLGSHASWLINEEAFTGSYGDRERSAALSGAASLGYDLAITKVKTETRGTETAVSIRITNRGVAPFYYDWPVEFTYLDANGNPVEPVAVDANLPTLLPGQTTEVTADVRTVNDTLAVRIPNPMAGGAPLKFSNAEQDADFPGYLTLG